MPTKDLKENIHNSIIYNIQKVEPMQKFIIWKIENQIVMYPYNGMLFSNKTNEEEMHAAT